MINLKFLPLILVELYLGLTLVLFFFGPIDYRIHDELYFYLFIFLYHFATIVGYVFGFGSVYQGYKPRHSRVSVYNRFWGFTSIAFISSIIGNANLAMLDTLWPSNIVQLFGGQFDAVSFGDSYKLKIANIDTFSGNKLLNIFYILVAWAKIVYIPFLIYSWGLLRSSHRFVGVCVAAIPLLSGVTTGTNKPIFDVFFMMLFSLLTLFASNKMQKGTYDFWRYRYFLSLCIISLLLALYFFTESMGARGVDYEWLESQSVLGDIVITCSQCLDSESGVLFGFVWLVNYVTQGYYGFSLSLGESFSSTFGFGNSPFLLRQFEWVVGIDLSNYTYQYKIDSVWKEGVQWHSAYSQFANDFHFIGVAFVLFVMGILLGVTWRFAIFYRSFPAMLLLPIFGIFYIFIPANNQVFGYVEGLSAFFFLLFVMFRGLVYERRS